jgi:hypothetical protein
MVRRFLVCFFMLCACSAYAANGGNGGDGGNGNNSDGGNGSDGSATASGRDGCPAERSLTRPENFIFQAQKSRAIRAGRMP